MTLSFCAFMYVCDARWPLPGCGARGGCAENICAYMYVCVVCMLDIFIHVGSFLYMLANFHICIYVGSFLYMLGNLDGGASPPRYPLL